MNWRHSKRNPKKKVKEEKRILSERMKEEKGININLNVSCINILYKKKTEGLLKKKVYYESIK